MTPLSSDLYADLKKSFLNGFKSRPHHAWILKGPKGAGKVQFAKELAAHLLGESDDHIASKIDQNAHPHFLYIAPTETKSISVEQIRHIFHFLQQKASDGGWKIVLLDSLNTLTPNGANGLLKILEAPPPRSLFLLIHHNGQPLLPTILSRCAQLSFAPCDSTLLSSLIPPSIADKERLFLLSLSQGQPNCLKTLLDKDALSLYSLFDETLEGFVHQDSISDLHAFAQKISKDTEKMDLFMEILEWWLNTSAKEIAINTFNFFKFSSSLSLFLPIHQQICTFIKWKKNLDLDGRQFILNIFFELKKLRAP